MANQLLQAQRQNMSKQVRKQESQQVSDTAYQSIGKVAGLPDFENDKPKPRVTEFVPRPCSTCQRMRELDDDIKGKSCSRVTSKHGRTRYCKCGFCKHTWKEVE